MKHLFNRICALLLLVPAWLSALASDSDVVTRLTLVGTDGTETHFNLYDKPEITFDEVNINIESSSLSASMPRTDLSHFLFTRGSAVVGIEDNIADSAISYTYIDNIFTVTGNTLSQLSVYDLSGILQLSSSPANGNVTADLNTLPAGMYIVSMAGHPSIKVIKK